jgi:hypothetical protein
MTATELPQERSSSNKKYAPGSGRKQLKFSSINHQNERMLFCPPMLHGVSSVVKPTIPIALTALVTLFFRFINRPSLALANLPGVEFTVEWLF